MPRISSEGAWARWGLLASAVVLAVALILASWSNYRSARAAVSALHAGQARTFEREILGTLRRAVDGPPEILQTTADSLLAAHAEEGLRYLAAFGETGQVMAGAGSPESGQVSLAPPVAAEPRYEITQVGSRVRVAMFRPRSRKAPPPPDEGRRFRHEPFGIVFEFEPLTAARLMEQARGLLVFGVAGSVAMTAVAVFFWGMSRRYENAKRHFERERRLSLLGEMSAVLAHEIRNPLASLKGNAQLLAEKLPPDSAERHKADLVIGEATRLESLTADLLDFVRVGPVERTPVDPGALIRASAQEVDANGFRLDLEHAPPTWPLDRTRMRQVFVNLLRNARQSTVRGGACPEIALQAENGRLTVTVRDHGEGLPKGQEERIFDPFFTTRATGTGLGLAVARRIVELHGGEITAHNHAQGGAVFTVSLPA